MGKVVFVGAGSGGISLLTLAGREVIMSANCIVYDASVCGEILNFAKKECRMFAVGEDTFHESVNSAEAGELLYNMSREYDIVARLIDGDSYVDGQIPKDAKLLQERNVETEVIPGVLKSEKILLLEDQPLWGKTFFIPYTKNGHYSFNEGWFTSDRDELSIKIRLLGGNVIPYKTGEVRPVECNLLPLKKIVDGDYVIFTSPNAVYATMWNICKDHMDVRAFGQARFAVLGKKTAAALEEFGLRPAIVSRKNTLSSLAEIMEALVKSDTRVIWYYSGESAKILDNSLYDKCMFEKYIVYENAQAVDIPKNRREIESCDGAIFTRSLTAKRTVTSVKRLPQKVYAFGGTCSRALRDANVKGIVESPAPTLEALIEMILNADK